MRMMSTHFSFFLYGYGDHRDLHSFPTRRSSDLDPRALFQVDLDLRVDELAVLQHLHARLQNREFIDAKRSEEQRLNSSHSQISYAVFCLKKKKKDKK